MANKSSIVGASILLILLACGVGSQSQTLDITTFGARPGGSDISQALATAWAQACASPTRTKIFIPRGTYALSSAVLKGPCKAPIDLQVEGIIQAPLDPARTNVQVWIMFQYIDQLTISGGGTFDGQGIEAWKRVNCHERANCPIRAYNLGFYFVTNSIIHDVTTLNSKAFHTMVFGCKNIQFERYTITAPEDSPNTDGIHIAKSNGVNVTDSNIRTGDDCISIGDGTENVGITRVTCGPGHGFSVGSLGKYPNEVPVVGIYLTNCTLIGTMTGIRIKSWPNKYGGLVSDVHARDIILDNVRDPILIDQRYCPWNQCNLQAGSKVKIAKASFKNIRGTSATQDIITVDCSSSYPCENVEFSGIDIKYNGPAGPAKSTCAHVNPIISGFMNPAVCTELAKVPTALRGH